MIVHSVRGRNQQSTNNKQFVLGSGEKSKIFPGGIVTKDQLCPLCTTPKRDQRIKQNFTCK